MTATTVTRRGTSNGNQRGSSHSRRSRRAFILVTYASNVPGFCRCYRCGDLLYNPDDDHTPDMGPDRTGVWVPAVMEIAWPLTVDRIIPGCQGGTYRRNNIRPACGDCNSETGGALRRKKERA